MNGAPSGPDVVLDLQRGARIGLPEAIYASGKSQAQLAAILAAAQPPLLLTRLAPKMAQALARPGLDYDAASETAIFGPPPPLSGPPRVAVVTAGTSDLPVAGEAIRTLRCLGEDCLRVADVGVAGLWRLLARLEEIRAMPVVLVAAGMDGALPSVVAGLVPGVVIGLPAPVGYGVAAGGQAALHTMLASCAPGLAVVNTGNGYGAACAALRVLRLLPRDGRTAPA